MDKKINLSTTFTFDESTSPSLLQDITLEQIDMDFKSPSATGLTMKEYEEQLKKLTVENFNLKLRVYFIEERLSKVNGIGDKEDLIKKNIQLQVSCEGQAKELEKKQELLFEASKAFEQLQNDHKIEMDRLIKDKEKEIAEMEIRLNTLETDLGSARSMVHGGSRDSESGMLNRQWDQQIFELEQEIRDDEERIEELEAMGRDRHLETQSLRNRLDQLELELEQRVNHIKELVVNLEMKENDLAAANGRIRKMEDAMALRQRQEQNAKDSLEEKERVISTLQASIAARDGTIAEVETKLAKERANGQSLQSKLDTLNFQNSRIKDEIDVLQSRLRRSPSILSPRSKSRSSEDDGQSRQKIQDLQRALMEKEDGYAKHLSDLEKTISMLQSEVARHEDGRRDHKKLEDDYRKACGALKNFIKRSNEDKREKEELSEKLRNKEEVIAVLKSKMENEMPLVVKSQLREDGPSDEIEEDEMNAPEATADNMPTETAGCPSDTNSYSSELEGRIQSILSDLQEKESLLAVYEQKILKCNCGVEEKMEKIAALEGEVLVLKTQLEERGSEGMEHLAQELESKKSEIKKLNGELRKRTYNLQELVNKELWDKNKQIERLEKRLNVMAESSEGQLAALTGQLEQRDRQLQLVQGHLAELGLAPVSPLALALAKDPALECDDVAALKLALRANLGERQQLALEVEELQRQLGAKPDGHSADCAVLRGELERSERTRREVGEVCSLLTTRLEELAGFLDSLLSHRELLTRISVKRRQDMRRAVEQSRDLSRSLSASVNMSLGDSCADASGVSFSRDRVICEQSMIIARLRDQLHNLSQEIRQRDIELSRCQSDAGVPYSPGQGADEPEGPCARKTVVVPESRVPDASESEAWSEPDLSVSLARMGRLDNTLTLRTTTVLDSTGSSEAEETVAETNKAPVKRGRSSDYEFRRLQSQVKMLEDLNEALRAELCSLKTFGGDRKTIDEHLGLVKKLELSAERLEEAKLTCHDLEEKLGEALKKVSISAAQLRKAETFAKALEDQIANLKEEVAMRTVQCEGKVEMIACLERKFEETQLESELRLIEAVKQKEVAERKVRAIEQQLADAECRGKEVETKVLEIEKMFHETKTFKNDTMQHVLEAEMQVDTAEKMMAEAEIMRSAADRRQKDLQMFIDLMRREVEEKIKDAERRVKKSEKDKEDVEKQVSELRERLHEAEVNKAQVENKVQDGKERIQCMEEKLRELEIAMDDCNEDALRKIREIQKRADARTKELEHQLQENEWVRKIELERLAEAERTNEELGLCLQRQKEETERLAKKNSESEGALAQVQQNWKAQEEALRQALARYENEKRAACSDLLRQLDEAKLAASKSELQLTRVTNEKIRLEEELKLMVEKESVLLMDHKQAETSYTSSIMQLEQQVGSSAATAAADPCHRALVTQLADLMGNKSQLASRLEEIEATNAGLMGRLAAIQGQARKSSPLGSEDYEEAADDMPSPVHTVPDSVLCNLLNDMQLCLPEINGNRQFLPQPSEPCDDAVWAVQAVDPFAPPRRHCNSSPDLGIESDQGRFSSLEAQQQTGGAGYDAEYRRLECENNELRRRLVKTKQALEDTVVQLAASNQRKKQVEKAICKQLHKTHHLLKKARVNFESHDTDQTE